MMHDGLQLMAIGMTAVFAFLAILVAVLSVMGAYFKRVPAPETGGTGDAGPGLGSPEGTLGDRIAAAAAVAFDRDQRRERGDETR